MSLPDAQKQYVRWCDIVLSITRLILFLRHPRHYEWLSHVYSLYPSSSALPLLLSFPSFPLFLLIILSVFLSLFPSCFTCLSLRNNHFVFLSVNFLGNCATVSPSTISRTDHPSPSPSRLCDDPLPLHCIFPGSPSPSFLQQTGVEFKSQSICFIPSPVVVNIYCRTRPNTR